MKRAAPLSGELLNFHPHVHLLVTDGVFHRDGSLERFAYFDPRLIERLFRAEVLRMLRGKGLISQDIVDNLLSWPHSGFSVNGDAKVPDRESAARLGWYMIRCPMVLERMSLDEDTGEVLYRTLASRADHPEGPCRPLGRVRAYRPRARSSAGAEPADDSLLGLLLECGAGQAACRRPPLRRRSRSRRGQPLRRWRHHPQTVCLRGAVTILRRR
jgi:hypothetical protein